MNHQLYTRLAVVHAYARITLSLVLWSRPVTAKDPEHAEAVQFADRVALTFQQRPALHKSLEDTTSRPLFALSVANRLAESWEGADILQLFVDHRDGMPDWAARDAQQAEAEAAAAEAHDADDAAARARVADEDDLTREEVFELAHSCTYCRSPQGTYCKKSSGRKAQRSHAVRRQAGARSLLAWAQRQAELKRPKGDEIPATSVDADPEEDALDAAAERITEANEADCSAFLQDLTETVRERMNSAQAAQDLSDSVGV